MKKFLLILGTLLCLQGCAFARDLRDFGNGFYADLDSLKKVGNYGYADLEYHSSHGFNMLVLNEYDLISYTRRIMKAYLLDYNGKIIHIIEEFELPPKVKGWRNIPQNSEEGVIIELLKEAKEPNIFEYTKP